MRSRVCRGWQVLFRPPCLSAGAVPRHLRWTQISTLGAFWNAACGPSGSRRRLERAVLPGPGRGYLVRKQHRKPPVTGYPAPTTSRPRAQQAQAEALMASQPCLKCLTFSWQANLAFDPAALLPGASPKSPGLKAVVSPFQSPPSTPSSPGVRSQAGEPEEAPVSFDQPPEGSHLPCYNKVMSGSNALWWVCGNAGTGRS